MPLTGSVHHQCLPWSLATGLGGTTEDANSPCSHYGAPTVLAKIYIVVNTVDPHGLSQRDITCPWTQCYHTPLNLALCTTRPGVTAYSSRPPPAGESLPLPKSVYKVCFFKRTDTYVRLHGSLRTRKT